MEVCMKKSVIFMVIAVLLAGTVSAQSRNDRQRERDRNDNSTTVEGTLKLEKGFIALQSGDSVYLVPGLNRYTGFISELKEGANVSVEGYVFRNIIRPVKITVAGKSYDLAVAGPSPEFGLQNDNFGPNRGNFGPGRNNRVPDRGNFGPNRGFGFCGCFRS